MLCVNGSFAIAIVLRLGKTYAKSEEDSASTTSMSSSLSFSSSQLTSSSPLSSSFSNFQSWWNIMLATITREISCGEDLVSAKHCTTQRITFSFQRTSPCPYFNSTKFRTHAAFFFHPSISDEQSLRSLGISSSRRYFKTRILFPLLV